MTDTSVIPIGWAARIIGKNHGKYMILLRPSEEVSVDDSRLDDVVILADSETETRDPPWFLQLYLKFMPGWEDCPHDQVLLERFLSFAETQRRTGYEEEFERTRDGLRNSWLDKGN